MDQETNGKLRQALELIRADKCQEASTILAGILTRDPNNERAWHTLSYALTDPEKQIYALGRVLQINPQNRAARSRLTKLSEQAGAPAPLPATAVTQPASLAQFKQAKESPPESGALADGSGQAEPKPASPKSPHRSASSPNPLSFAQERSWPSGAAVVAVAPAPGVILFPGIEARRAVKHSSWQRLRIRAGLSWRRLKMDWAVFSQSRLAILGVIIITMFGLMAIAHPILMRTVWPRAIYDPTTGFDMQIFQHPTPPGSGHLLGTDTLGRDVLSMLLAATTPTFILGLTAALATAVVGTAMSVTAAYFRGPVDAIITNVADVFLLFPAPVVMVIIGARFRTLGPVPLGLIYGFVIGAGPTTLVMRAHALQVVSKPYMEAAHIAGGGSLHTITKHLLPAMMPLAALQMMIAVTGAVVADGFISFFGLTRTVSNWGTLIYDAFVYANISSVQGALWHMLLPAALSFSLFAMGFYLVSRGLHRVASPTIREEQAVA